MKITDRRNRSSRCEQRKGVTLVENALVLSILGVFFTGIMEFGHAYMIKASMNSAAHRAARFGSVEGVTTEQALNFARNVLAKSMKMNHVNIQIKDAAIFDNSSVNTNNIKYEDLPAVELHTMEESHLFLIRITVPYKEVSLLPPFWSERVTLQSISVTRHE